MEDNFMGGNFCKFTSSRHSMQMIYRKRFATNTNPLLLLLTPSQYDKRSIASFKSKVFQKTNTQD
jgi:hypothetical protein